ncbi:gamma-aminobutyric acid type B receptor subunit 2-like [Clytia hemisphaerica]|uniref:G-protein coupled receptors family 3 profile domain-containing protein n=1 Tax=Clytia hemisphaerica TaxID=252671 RepID=A0A7M5U6D5_9CNID
MRIMYCLLLVITQNYYACTSKQNIYFGAFLSNIVKDDLCFKAAIDVAVRLINEDDTILKDFKLKVKYFDNLGMSGFGMTEFFHVYQMKETLQFMLGPFTEQFAEPMRLLTDRINLPMVEDNGKTFQSQRKALVALLNHFGWKKLHMLYDIAYIHFVQNANQLKKLLKSEEDHSIDIQGFSSVPYFNVEKQIQNIKKHDGRIIFIDMDRWTAPTIFCDIYLQNMSYPRHIFISGNIHDLENNWHEMTDDNTRRCTSQQILKAAEGFLFLKRSDFQINGGPRRAKKTRGEIWELIKRYKQRTWNHYINKYVKKKKFREEWDKITYNKGSGRVFDLVYRAALALDKLIKQHGAEKVLMKSYHDTEKYSMITKAIKTMEFYGVSGKQRDMDLGHDLDHVIHQYRNGSFVEVGYYTTTTNTISFHTKLFNETRPPRDGVLLQEVFLEYKWNILLTLWIGAFSGILIALSLLFLNWSYRHKRVIKMSSPKVNNLIILGCISCYLSIIFFGLDSRFTSKDNSNTMCTATISSLSIGFTLSFGGLFSKTWRVYRIFAAARTNSRIAVRDVQLYIMIVVLLSIDISILLCFITFNPFHLEGFQLSQKFYPQEDRMEIQIHQLCSCSNQTAFVATLVSFKVLLLIFGLFMAWETRHVHIPVLNDSKHIGLAVYFVAFVSTIGAICSTALSTTGYFEESYLVIGLSIFLCTTSTLLLVFLGKVSLIFDKTGRDRTHSTSSIISSSSYSYQETPTPPSKSLPTTNSTGNSSVTFAAKFSAFSSKKRKDKYEKRLRSESLLSREDTSVLL